MRNGRRTALFELCDPRAVDPSPSLKRSSPQWCIWPVTALTEIRGGVITEGDLAPPRASNKPSNNQPEQAGDGFSNEPRQGYAPIRSARENLYPGVGAWGLWMTATQEHGVLAPSWSMCWKPVGPPGSSTSASAFLANGALPVLLAGLGWAREGQRVPEGFDIGVGHVHDQGERSVLIRGRGCSCSIRSRPGARPPRTGPPSRRRKAAPASARRRGSAEKV
ncbi:hypothetical protein Srot_2306 [Segniliparus rotundus DSM 44985]|uniref:Uncharacterized protein n=1 Tax=Segniliparus rotundus (strain ATCC BAA-972 / CDC 1076 / CIP 108378 / DSM 44985 / JCM 13578) TaxID=640132 RepID=D6ZAL9_SEGRD|nr:hypothetical protein Srot_2306 [Segniliparus rotundus DSM 44985]